MMKIRILGMAAAMMLTSCNGNLWDKEKDLTLRLDFPEENTYNLSQDLQTYTVYTDVLTYSFDIVSGAGGYAVTVEDYVYIPGKEISLPAGRATLDGKTVTVELLTDAVDVVISDKTGTEAHVWICSSNSALKHFGWNASIPYGGPSRNDIGFGAGAPYKIVYYSDASAEDAAIEGSLLKTGDLRPGRHWYLISDCRGTVRKFEINVRGGFDIEGESLTVSSKADMRLTFPFKWGKGWTVVEGETGPETFVYNISHGRDTFFQDTFVVHIGAESASWTFVDKEGKKAELTIEIES